MRPNNKSAQFNAEQQQLAKIARVFSHPARIAIVQLLAEKKEIKTGNISDHLPIGRTTVSRHLRELRDAGVIRGTIDGLHIHYCLDVDQLAAMENAFQSFFVDSMTAFSCKC